jgi:predicted nucleic acid-binding protein
MTVVVADSSPLNYLTLIGSIEVLRRLYGSIIVPRQVIAELTDLAAPSEVREWALDPPRWVDVRVALASDSSLLHLDPGERAALVLAQSESDALLLIDDAAGRLEASRRGIAHTGTLGVLRAASVKNLVDLPTALSRLLKTNFRVPPELVSEMIAEDAERRRT